MQSSINVSTATSKAAPASTYDQIYELAKNEEMDLEEKVALLDALTSEYSIDLSSGSDPFESLIYTGGMLTPAGKLAAEGNIKAVNFLIEQGADVGRAAYGAAYGEQKNIVTLLREQHGHDSVNMAACCEAAVLGKHINYAKKLRQGIDIDIYIILRALALACAGVDGAKTYTVMLLKDAPDHASEIAGIAASVGNKELAEYLRINEYFGYTSSAVVDPDLVACGAAEFGDQEYAEDLCTLHGANIDASAVGAAKGKHFDNQNDALRILSQLRTDNYRTYLAYELTKEAKLNYNIRALVPIAKTASRLIPSYTLNPAIAMAEHPELQTWFLYSTVIIENKKIDYILLSYIATFVGSISQNESEDTHDVVIASILKSCPNYFKSKNTLFQNKYLKREMMDTEQYNEEENSNTSFSKSSPASLKRKQV